VNGFEHNSGLLKRQIVIVYNYLSDLFVGPTYKFQT